ncbi:MAG: ATP-binding protein [Elusimicrobia bacterium]|nr:ATP-binding protein [Elusimicrobiota bacterium]
MEENKHPIEKNPLFGQLPLELSENIRSLNPWWSDEAAPTVPSFHRWIFKRLNHMLHEGLTPATVLRGPRRVGKTVILRQIIEDLLGSAVIPSRILYLPFDELPTMQGIQEPILTVARWFEREVMGCTFNTSAQQNQPAYLLLDEVQNLESWAPQVKNLVDNHSMRMLITGSSSLRIEAGRDSLAGRISTVDLGPLSTREIAEMRFGARTKPIWNNGLNGIAIPDFWRQAVVICRKQTVLRRKAFAAFSDRGAYPVAHERKAAPWSEIADYLNETVIQRAIRHDLRMGAWGQKRDEKLLEEVFRLCCRYAGQAPGQRIFVPEIHQALSVNIGWNRILDYLQFLDKTLLIRLIRPLELRLKRQSSPPKVCLCDHSLRASWLQEVVPLDPDGLSKNPHLSDLAGHLAESALGYFLASIPNLDVAYFPARGTEPEVDFVITVGTKRIPIEVKYRKYIDPHDDTLGLRAFLEKSVYNAPFGLLVTLEDDVTVLDPRIIPISLSALLWLK